MSTPGLSRAGLGGPVSKSHPPPTSPPLNALQRTTAPAVYFASHDHAEYVGIVQRRTTSPGQAAVVPFRAVHHLLVKESRAFLQQVASGLDLFGLGCRFAGGVSKKDQRRA